MVQREQKGRRGVIAIALTKKLRLLPPVVTILAKLAEKITKGNGFELLCKWFFMLSWMFSFFPDTQPTSAIFRIKKRVLITKVLVATSYLRDEYE